MSEKNVVSENESMVDAIFGDAQETADHSRSGSATAVTETQETAPDVKDDAADFDPLGEKSEVYFADESAEEAEKESVERSEKAPEASDSAESKNEKAPEKTAEEYTEEITKLNKRLHDTQKAFHESRERAASLQKKLDEIESKKHSAEAEDDDNWFDDSDDKAVTALKKEISEIKAENESFEAEQEEIQKQVNLTAWHQAAAEVRAKHSDFDEVVYEKFEPLLDEETGDPRVRALYMQQQDKTPAGAYKFAKNLPFILEMLDNPDSFQEKIRSVKDAVKNNNTEETPRKVTGKAGLDMVNSADYPEEKSRSAKSLVDEIFG
jgi:hypothetical protein